MEHQAMFYDWLMRQRARGDRVGELARWAIADPAFPRETSAHDDLVEYMRGRGAREDAVEAAREAWEEFGAEATDYTPPDQIVDVPDEAWDEEIR